MWMQSTKRNSFTTSHQQADAQALPGQQVLSTHSSCLGRQMFNFECPVPPPPFSLLLLLSVTSYGMGYPFGLLGSAVLSLSPPSLLPIPTLLAFGRRSGLERQPWCCASTAWQKPKHWCVVNTAVAANAKLSTTWDAVRKTNSILARTSTGLNYLSFFHLWLSLQGDLFSK